MTYKVFLVEDEIVAREGIRDNVDWASVGFTFCGEAPDGEMALPLIEQSQPDVLITDIKMPFMDGLQLSRLVKERMPQVKIIVLSGHDEFDYAQAAIKLGITEYLLKPVGVKDLHDVLTRVAQQLAEEHRRKENLEQLKVQLENNRAIQQEQFLLKLVMGGITPLEAIEQSRRLELDIIAACYQVVLVRIELFAEPAHFDYHQYQQVMQFIDSLIGHNPDILMVKKDMEELVLVLKGTDPTQLRQETNFLAELLKNEAAGKSECRLRLGVGHPQQRLGISFALLLRLWLSFNPINQFKLRPGQGPIKPNCLNRINRRWKIIYSLGLWLTLTSFFTAILVSLILPP